ncbi:MAG: hypothetical protein QM611_06610, partial [Microbacterium sp.]|uniref:hypothetical protein n=1 Tax=Microbacterium sp. TaxID=51671 RepID=UPI0039E51DDF
AAPPGLAGARPVPGGVRAAASPWPLIVAAAAFGLSVLLAVVLAATPASDPVRFLGAPLPLVVGGFWWVSLAGYLLTPAVVLACYGWNAVAQRKGLGANRNFVLRPGWSRALRWLAGLSIVVGAWHVLNLSVPLSAAWGGS